MGQTKGDAVAFLISYAADPDAEIRAAAALAMSMTETPGAAGDRLLGLLAAEKDPEVRARLYQALGNQANSDLAAVMRGFASETDPRARIAGLDFLAGNMRAHSTEDWLNYFEQNAVGELKQDALAGATRDQRSAAVVALKRAGTPGASAALQEIALQAGDPRIAEAAASAHARPPVSGAAK